MRRPRRSPRDSRPVGIVSVLRGSGAGGAVERRRILAMGGGGFTMQERSPALDRLVLTLTRRPVPRICFMPTASGDPREQVTRFYERFGEWPCEPTMLSLFNLGRDRIDPIAHLARQDAIYIGGGSMRNMLAIWREHGIDEAVRAAWERGAILSGLSAGAMCWFEGGISMSGGLPEVVRGIGLLPVSLSVHLGGEPERIPAYHAAVAAGELPPGFAADDGAALLFAGESLLECVASDPDARVLRVTPDGLGGVVETAMPVRHLAGASAALMGAPVEGAVSELRALRAGRHRWD
jgi:dipeptidase E